MAEKGKSRARRPRHPTPACVREALERAGLMDAYRERPPYQRHDYIGWITRAKRSETRHLGPAQLLDERAAGARRGWCRRPIQISSHWVFVVRRHRLRCTVSLQRKDWVTSWLQIRVVEGWGGGAEAVVQVYRWAAGAQVCWSERGGWVYLWERGYW